MNRFYNSNMHRHCYFFKLLWWHIIIFFLNPSQVYNDQNAIPLPFIMQCCITSNDTTHILWTLSNDTGKSHIFLFHRLCSHLKIFLFPCIANRYGNAHLKHFVNFVLYGYVCVLLYAFVYNSRSTGRENKIRFKGAPNRLYFCIMHVALSRFYDRLRCNLLYYDKGDGPILF